MHITPLTGALLGQHYQSYLETLSALSPVGDHTLETLLACLIRMEAQGTKVFVALDTTKGIIGTISVLIEYKMNRGGSRAGHLEDLAVHSDAQGQGIGSTLINQAIDYAKTQGCYKLILDADKDPAHVGYYEKFGFETKGAFMKLTFS